MIYMRKLDNDAWDGKPINDSDSISDLGTKNHELSVWEIDEDLNNIDDIALALALTRNDTRGFMTVLLDPEEINKDTGFQITIQEQEGQSLYVAQNSKHKNFMLYTIDDMSRLASYIHSIIDQRDATKFRFFEEQEFTDLLIKKFDSGELDKEAVSSKGLWKKKYNDYEKSKKSIAPK